MPKDVLAWLNGNRDYFAGVELLRSHGCRAFIINMLAKGPDAYNTPKLLAELQKLQSQDPPAPAAAPARVEPAASKPAIIYKPDHDLEKQLRIKKMISDLFKEMTHLHGKLSNIPTVDQRYQVAKQLKLKDIKRIELFQQISYFERHKVWFDELPENDIRDFNPNDPAQREQRINNLMAYRSKDKKVLKKPQSPGKTEHHQKRIADFTKEIKYLRTLRYGTN